MILFSKQVRIDHTLHANLRTITAMPIHPSAQRLLAQAREDGQWYAYQPEAIGLCFEALTLEPQWREAEELVYQLMCDEWLIYNNRVAVQQNIDEWDDRPHQQRRRLALSFRFMSQWEGWHREHEDGYEREKDGPPDVETLLDTGRAQLLHAYCLGDEEATTFAWQPFQNAIEQTNDPRHALLWIGKLYADLGFFADAVEILAQLCSRYPDLDYKRLLVEVKWWRDRAAHIPWLPPTGDGSRYRRMMQHIDPSAPTNEEVIRDLRTRIADLGKTPQWTPTISPHLASLIETSLPALSSTPALAVVDWGFLDRDDGKPSDPPEWVHRSVELMKEMGDEDETGREMIADTLHQHQWTRPIVPPTTPKRFHPDDEVRDDDDEE